MGLPKMRSQVPQPGAAAPFAAEVLPEWVDYNGHMSEAYYVLVFGHATDAFYDHVGLDHAARTRHLVSIYTVEAHIRYLAEAHAGDRLHIITRLLGHDSKRLRLHHAMVRQSDQALLAVTELMLLHVDKTILRATPFHPGILAAIDAVAGAETGAGAPEPATSAHWAAAHARPGLDA
jgi:acyl-CoA thioesterase FadM